MCEVKKCENLRLKPFLCMIWKEKVARHVDFGCLLGAKQACNHIVRNEIRGGGGSEILKFVSNGMYVVSNSR